MPAVRSEDEARVQLSLPYPTSIVRCAFAEAHRSHMLWDGADWRTVCARDDADSGADRKQFAAGG